MKTPVTRPACFPTWRPKTRRSFRLPDPAALTLRLLLLTPALGSLPAASPAATRVWGGVNGDLWSDNGNWQGGVAPVDGDDVVFGASGRTAVTDDFLARALGVVTFAASAPGYQLTITSGGPAGRVLTLNGAGIVNNSAAGTVQNVIVAAQTANGDPGARLEFRNSATIGAGVTVTARGGTFDTSPTGAGLIGSGNVRFYDTATAGRATIFNEGHAGAFTPGGRTQFSGSSSAADATITNGVGRQIGASASFGQGGATEFSDNASAGNANLANASLARPGFLEGGTISFRGSSTAANAQITNGNGGRVFFDDASRMGASTIRNLGGNASQPQGAFTNFQGAARGDTATVILEGATANGAQGAQLYVSGSSLENATVTANGATAAGGGGGIIQFDGPGRAGNATLTANGGTNGGGGGTILFFNTSQGNTARAIVNAGATLDNSGYQGAAFSIGSIEGAGTFAIGAFSAGGGTFTVGANNRSTTVSGVIQNGGQYSNNVGTLIKTGFGTLTLSGANTYTGATTVNSGTLLVDGSITGNGVTVGSGGRLGGGGTINAPVTVATGGTLAPGTAAAPGTLSTGSLTLDATSKLNFRLSQSGVVGGPSNDLLIVNGNVTLAGNLNVADSGGGGFTLGAYRLINYSGALTNNGLAIGTVPAGLSASDFTVQTGTAGRVNLLVGGGTDVLYWDGAQTASNNAVDGGTGSWNNAATNWTNAPGRFNAPWAGKTAVFAGPAGSGGAVTLTENVSSTALQFSTTGYEINANPGLALTLTGSAALTVDPGLRATLNAPLTGAGSLNKTGDGALTLGGANSYTGGTVVADGVLVVTDPGGAGLGAGPVTVRATATSVLRFTGTASAGGISITNNPGADGIATGVTEFRNAATAGTASVTNQASAVAGGLGGLLFFGDEARAGSARIANLGATVDDGRSANSGFTTFSATASAGSAVIDNLGSAVPGTVGGLTQFLGGASAGDSTITNRRGASVPATFGLGGETRFSDDSLGGAATILNAAGDPDGTGGALRFTDRANAQNARVTNAGAADAFVGGSTSFTGTASAGQATLTQGGATTILGDGGRLNFYDDTRAGSARIVNNGAPAAAGGNPATTAGGVTTFYGNSSADGAALVNEAGTGPAGGFARSAGGTIAFVNNATAGNATIDNRGGVPAVSGGRVTFDNTSTAAAAAITNGGGLSPTRADGEAELTFSGASSAGTAAIVNQGGTFGTSEGGATFFQGTASAAGATITNRGGSVSGAGGGRTFFFGSSSAGTATLSAESGASGGTGAGGGGSFIFLENSTANLARVILAGGGPGVSPGSLDIGGLNLAGTNIGSIEGGGVISLGGKVLVTGFNGRSTTFSGLIRDGGLVNAVGGSLRVLGPSGADAALTLSGANTYTGGTSIGDGSNADSGKLIVTNTLGSATGGGPVTIRRGGTLGGSGFIAGPVTLQAGGVIAPGDPVTLTLQDSLTWDGGSTIRLVLGADQAGSDLLEISGAFTRGDASGGLFVFDLVDAGALVGQTYDFVHFGSIEGFTVGDFAFTGVAGTFAIQDGALGFTVTGVVPEPAVVVWLALIPGATLLLLRHRVSQRRAAAA